MPVILAYCGQLKGYWGLIVFYGVPDLHSICLQTKPSGFA
jgi:hypothetical protein